MVAPKRSAIAPLAVFALLLIFIACPGQPPGDPPGTETDSTAVPAAGDRTARVGAQQYEVRGEVMSIPRPGDVQSTFSVRHEAIDDFVGADGEVWGMDSMTMPFELGPQISLEGIEPGDKVAFTLRIDFFGDVPQQVTDLRELAADTALEFRKAQPPKGSDDDKAMEHDGHSM